MFPKDVLCLILVHLPVEQQARCRRLSRYFARRLQVEGEEGHWPQIYTRLTGGREFPYLEYSLKRFRGLDPAVWNWEALCKDAEERLPAEFQRKYALNCWLQKEFASADAPVQNHVRAAFEYVGRLGPAFRKAKEKEALEQCLAKGILPEKVPWKLWSKCSAITPEVVLNHPDWDYVWEAFVENPSIPWGFIYRYLDRIQCPRRCKWEKFRFEEKNEDKEGQE